jgi:hypothetical protein
VSLKVDVKNAKGSVVGSVDLPAELFDVQANIPLIHQVVTLELQRLRTAVKLAVAVRSLSSRREQEMHVRVLFVLLCNATVVFHMVQSLAHMINAHQRR